MKLAVLFPAVALGLLAATTAGDRTAGIAQLKRAAALQREGKSASAIKLYDSAARNLPQLNDWIDAFAAAAAAQQGDTLQVTRRLNNLDTLLVRDWAWRTRVRAYVVAGAAQRALEVAQAATMTGPAWKRADAWYRLAELRRDGGNRDGERSALWQSMRTAPASDAAIDAARRLAELNGLSADQQLAVGRALLRVAPTKGIAQLQRAVATGELKPDSEADARFLLGRAQHRSGKRDAGRAALQNVINNYPTSHAATRALYFLADLAHDNGDIDDAAALYEKTAASPSKADETALALMRIGDIAFVREDYPKAAKIFTDFRARYPPGDVHDQATYWAALSLIRSGNTATGNQLLRELRRTSPLSYYGIRAADVIGGDLLDGGLAEPPTTNAEARQKVNAGMVRWELLREVGWDEAAAFELYALKQRFASDKAALYEIAEELNRQGAPYLAIGAGREILTRNGTWDRRLLRIMYPMPYEKLIKREARARGLDPYLVAALIRQESRFNRKAISGAGAVGLMQVMPATGKQLRRKTGVGKVTQKKLTEPEINVKLGTKFLADLMGMYGSRIDAVLVAYNAGPSRAYRWRGFPEYRAGDLFVERIPFDETREYVKVVMSNAAIYRALYNESSGDD